MRIDYHENQICPSAPVLWKDGNENAVMMQFRQRHLLPKIARYEIDTSVDGICITAYLKVHVRFHQSSMAVAIYIYSSPYINSSTSTINCLLPYLPSRIVIYDVTCYHVPNVTAGVARLITSA